MSRLVRGIGATSILALAIVGAGCSRQNRETRERAADEATGRDRDMQRDREAGGITISNINSEPQNYYGKNVTVSGEVDKLLNPRAFQVSGAGMMNNDMLVVTKKPLSDMHVPAGQLTEDAKVQVTGTVRRFVMRDIEKETGFDLDDKLFSDWRDKPVLIADSIAISPVEQPAGAGQRGERKY